MASTRLFEAIPPFPDDVPTASMTVIPLVDLRAGNESALKSLFASAQSLGFFLLDLHNDGTGKALIREIDDLFGVAKATMDLPDDIKQMYPNDPPRSFLGFKPRGGSKTETMEPDRFEWFNLGQDGLLGSDSVQVQPLPEVVQAQLPLFKSFLEHAQEIIQMICRILATRLGLASDAFTSLQRPSNSSGTVIRFLKAHACPTDTDLRTSMVHHTDFGTITLLANVLGGLQILTPGRSPKDADSDAWLWVRPQPGCLIVNLGDAMVKWTGGLLRSNVHRIRYPPGQQRFLDRYSIAVLVRPDRNASMRRLAAAQEEGSEEDEDGNLTAWEWEVKTISKLVRGEDTVESKGGRP